MSSIAVFFIALITAVVALAAGAAAGYFYKQRLVEAEDERQNRTANHLIREAEEKAKEIRLQAEEETLQFRKQAEKELSQRRAELNKEEERLQRRREEDEDRIQRRRDELDGRADRLEKQQQALNKRQSQIDKRANEIEKMYTDKLEELQRVAQMSVEEARGVLLQEAEKEARSDMARIIRQIETEAREEGERRARKLIADAIQRVASEHVNEVTTKSVTLPSDEMKGRIIGRNGRNIQAFEQAAGVDVIVDDTPESVIISCFDPVRREIARRSLEKLVLDGRIHPAYIEKVLKKETQEVEKIIAESGEQAAYEAGVAGLHPEIIKMMGRLKFRTSFGQNQLSHAIETSKLASAIAAELGADVELAKTGAFLHDIGKAMDHNVEGTHAAIGADFVRRYGMNARVINAIAAHHHEVEQETVEAIIVEAADAISGARPGARRESLEQYIKRVKALEEIANSHKGVQQSYALQAGREVRILVSPDDIDDLASARLARDIAKQIEETMQYPGQIKVTVIRETRAVDYAK
ncbi:MAG: ribonuclease Y [Anaerolineales bacterium]